MELLPAVLVAVLAAVPADDVRRAAREVLAGGGYQKDLPAAGAAVAPPVAPARTGIRLPTFGGGLLTSVAFWAAVIILVAAGLSALWPSGPSFANLPAPPAAAPRPPPREGPHPSLARVEELAREGQFGRAIHALLLCMIDELRSRSPAARTPSLTARELTARVQVHESQRRALAAVVDEAERVHFGGRRAGADEYERCLEAFQRFRRPPSAADPA
jgi:hypothetical protein